jgi:hypothetical protein
MKAFLLINNFTHDLFTGLWTSSILVIYLLTKKASEQALLAAELHSVIQVLFWLVIGPLVMVMGTGLIRFIYYRPATDGSAKITKSILIYKHILLGVVFVGGTFLAYWWTFC